MSDASDARYGGFTVRADCRVCGQPIPINAPEASVHCDHCQSDGALPGTTWRAILRDFDEDHGAFPIDRTAGKTVELDGWVLHFARRRAVPSCEKCGAPYPADRISEHATRDFFCVACGDPASTYPRPAWLSTEAPTARQIVLTEPRGAGAAADAKPLAPPEAARPVLMQCPGCGAPLALTPASPRTVRCDHCRADVYLPDDLWRRLHPAKTMREWYVRFEGKTDKQREADDRRAAAAAQATLAELRRAEEREARELRAASERAHAEAEARAHDEAVRRATKGAYLGLLPLFSAIASVIVLLVVCGALDVELPVPGLVAAGALQLGFAVLAAIMTARPIKVSLRADGNSMMSYHWIWVIFSLFVFPFGPIVFFVGVKRFFGTFGEAVISTPSGSHFVKAATLAKRESWPAALFFLAMSVGVASEVATAFVVTQDQAVQSPARRR